MNEVRPKILYIDDDDGLRRLAQRGLTRRGYDVTLAASGAEGIALAASQRFDLVTVDHYMPELDGLQTLERLRALHDAPPVIYVTGSEEGRVAIAALRAGAVDYVVKTVGDDFLDLLARAIDNELARAELTRGKLAAEQELRSSHSRLEALLREVNHRVANSLQLVSAFVRLQSSAIQDPQARAALEDTQRRITAIGSVHRRLYSSDDVEGVEMFEYLTALIDELTQSWSSPEATYNITLSADTVRVTTDHAVSIGIIVNELVSNACKYAYGTLCGGEIRVELRKLDEARFELSVEDDGIGMIDGASPKGTGLGTKLVRAMAQSLHSAVTYDSSRGGVRASLVAAIA